MFLNDKEIKSEIKRELNCDMQSPQGVQELLKSSTNLLDTQPTLNLVKPFKLDRVSIKKKPFLGNLSSFDRSTVVVYQIP